MKIAEESFQYQRSKVKVVCVKMCECYIMAEAYISAAWRVLVSFFEWRQIDPMRSDI